MFSANKVGFDGVIEVNLGPRTQTGGGFVHDETMMEKMDVTDLECGRVPGRLFSAAALENSVSDGSELPDPVLHRGSATVPECNNPYLVHGVYPTLFPTGAGAFGIPIRACPLSFAKQVNLPRPD